MTDMPHELYLPPICAKYSFPISHKDVQYIRADIHQAEITRLEKLLEENGVKDSP